MQDQPKITSLRFYPVKSCQAVELESAHVSPRGLMVGTILDRSWMVVDEEGILISQRETPELARVQVELLGNTPNQIRLSVSDQSPIILDASTIANDRQKVIIHGKETVAHTAPQTISDWFTACLGISVQAVFQKDDDVRLCNAAYAVTPSIDAVSFADGFPYLITTEGTLQNLNRYLDQAVPMNRFRPNIVIDAVSDAEYGWKEIAVGNVGFRLVKPCTRCVMTTIDQQTGERENTQPLATLAKLYFLREDDGTRKIQGAVFGENAIATSHGQISVGDSVSILATKPMHNFIRREIAPKP